MSGKITYHQQVSYCGKPHCRRCREGIGHGPYWYAYQTVNGRTVRTYVGKQPPAEMLGGRDETKEAAADLADVVVRLYVLGQFRLEHRSGQHWYPATDAVMQHQRVRSLLSCLVSSPGRKLGREQAMDMLWPDLDFETATHRLDRAVHSLRQLLEPGRSPLATSNLLLTEHQTLLLADQTRLWTDADAFEALLTQARATSDPGQTERLLEEAMMLYAGDFLPEERHLEWTQRRRESLQRNWIGLLLELADLRIAREALPSAIDTLDRLLAIDSTNEAAAQRLMILLAQSGRRGEAIRVYQRFAAVLKHEYNITPLLETRTLYETVQRGADPVAQSGAGKLLAEKELPGLPVPQTGLQSPRQDSPTGISNTQHPVSTIEPGTQSPPAMQQGDRDAGYSMHIGRSHQSPLIGRDQELEVLHQLLLTTEQATRMKLAGQKKAPAIAPLTLETQRRPHCVMVMGDVGIGKTRLAEEAGREAKQRGWAVAWTRAYAQESSIPYRMWTEALRKAMTQGLWQRQEVSKRPLIYQSLRALLPELQDLLPQSALPSIAPPEQEQLHLWEAARSLLAAISENTPLLIVLDDLQWADNSSCDLLGYLVRQLRGYPVMIIGTCRDSELPANHPLRNVLIDLQREQAIETLNIQPLTNEQIRSLVAYLPEPMVEHIQTRAAGNPFFAEELARSVRAQFIATNQAESRTVGADLWRPSPMYRPDEHAPALPDTISAVLDLRMGRISNACQRLLARAAVLGGTFDFHSIRSMDASNTADEDTVLDLLEEALQAGMLTEEGTGSRITYHFWHPLLVSHLYDSLSAARRASLHRRAAEVTRQLYQGREEEGAAAIEYHLINGGAESSQIAHYAELAGNRAYTLSAYPEAERHYRLAIEYLGIQAEDAQLDERLHLAYLLERLGECTMIQGNFEEARHYYEQVLEVRSQQHIFTSQAEYQQEAQLHALFWREIGLTWRYTGNNAMAQQCRERGEQVLREVGVVGGPAWASLYYQQSSICWQEGNYDDAMHAAHEALKLFEETLSQQQTVGSTFATTRMQRTLVGDPVDLGRVHRLLANIAVAIGQSTDALNHLNTALTIFEQHDRQREIAIVCSDLGDIYLGRAELRQARVVLRRSLSIMERIGDIPSLSVSFGNLGVLSYRLGDLAEAEDWYKRGLALAEQVNDPAYISVWHSYLANAAQDQGKLDQAALSVRQALKIGRTMNIIPCIGLALIALGHLRIAQTIVEERNSNLSPLEVRRHRTNNSTRLLIRARAALHHALALKGLEAETRTEGQLALAQVSLLLDELETAQQQTLDALEEARRYELIWLLPRSQRLLGNVLSAQGQWEQADAYFEQAIQVFSDCGMRLERARTLQSYGMALLERSSEASHQHGLSFLQEARQAFRQCNAVLDLQAVERILSVQIPRTPEPARKNTRKGR